MTKPPSPLPLVLAAATAAVLLACSSSSSPSVSLHATLDANQEVPPTVTTASGTGTFTLDGDGVTLRYRVQDDVTGVNAAHIHRGSPGQSGPVLFSLFPVATSTDPHDLSGTFTLTASQAAVLLTGGMYVNVHSSQFMTGEIRGQITR